ncbi:hypothetical protein [Marinicellulosiphila megalodicopiae]|uniref:hypothetical protein n=1 Tax=Marinicellulosiphila megalodicopiae TaxID=2724896 RepID=UPI003BB1A131
MKFLKAIGKVIIKLIPLALLLGIGIFAYRYFDASFFNSHSQWAPPIFNGVVSGVVTAGLLVVLSITFRSHLKPTLENLQYRGVKIEGVWNGVLVPFIGVDEIDKRRIKIGMAEIRRRKKSRKEKRSGESSETNQISATAIGHDGSQRNIEAELIANDVGEGDSDTINDSEVVGRRFFIAVSKFSPIEVRAQFERVGHEIKGEIVEIGGASDIHTYSVRGSFKNLILTGEYENNHSGHIDRGSLSLMLVKNGREFRGFFSSYADSEHKIVPFRCVLRRHGMDQESETFNKDN